MSDVYLVWSDKSKHSTDSKTDLLIFKAQNQTLPNIYAKLTRTSWLEWNSSETFTYRHTRMLTLELHAHTKLFS